MVQQAARAESPPEAADRTLAELLGGLGREWTIIRACRLRPADGGDPPTVLIHPGRGVAVLDAPPSETPDAIGAVRAKLDEARFEAIFTGHLPVVHVRASPRRMASLPDLLDDAFAALPPLDLPGGDAWAGVAARTLVAEPQQAPPRRAVPQPPGASLPDGGPPRRTRRPRRRGRALLRKAGAVLLCLTALAGVLALALNEAKVAETTERASEPLAAAAVSPAAAPAVAVPAVAPPQPGAAPTPRPAAAPTPRPAPEPQGQLAPVSPAPDAGGATAAARPGAQPSTPPPPETPAPAAPQRAAPPPPRRPEPPPPQAGRPAPPDRAAPAQQQRRQPPQDAGAPDPSPSGGAQAGEAAPQRCARIGARVGSGAPLGEADMRFFNEACVRW